MDEPDPLWLSALEAVEVCRRLFGLDESAARGRLILLAEQMAVTAWCATWYDRFLSEWATVPLDTWEDGEVPAPFWERVRKEPLMKDWPNGTFGGGAYERETYAHGVRFNRLDLINHKRKLSGLKPLSAIPPPPPPGPLAEPRQISHAPPPIPPLRAYRQAGVPGEEISLAEVARRQEAPRATHKAKPKVAPSGTHAKKKGVVLHPEFKVWYEALPTVDQARGWRWLYDAAKAHFHPRRPPKGYVLELVKDRPLGRPKST